MIPPWNLWGKGNQVFLWGKERESLRGEGSRHPQGNYCSGVPTGAADFRLPVLGVIFVLIVLRLFHHFEADISPLQIRLHSQYQVQRGCSCGHEPEPVSDHTGDHQLHECGGHRRVSRRRVKHYSFKITLILLTTNSGKAAIVRPAETNSRS